MDGDTLSVTIQNGSAGGTVLGTVPSIVDGALWYEVNNNVPMLNLHVGNFNYGFKHDSITYTGDNSHLVAYLPFDVSTTVDACGNEWTATGGVSLSTEIKKFGTASVYLPQNACLSAQNILDINAAKWTFDAWAYVIKSGILFSIGATGIGDATGIRVDGNNFIAPNSNNDWAFIESIAISLNEWHHIAVVKNGSSLRLFIDGTLTKDKTLTTTMYGGGFFLLGTTYNDMVGYQPNFYVDNVRLFKGVARWDSDFTPPTAADYP